MRKPHHVKITATGPTGGECRVEVDGRDISDCLNGATVNLSVGDANLVELSLIATTLELEIDADIRTRRDLVKFANGPEGQR